MIPREALVLHAHPSAYRKALVQLAPVLLAAFVVVQGALTDHTPLNDAGMWWQVAVAGVGALLVYGPPDPWVKTLFALVAAVGATVTGALTDNALTGTEVIQILVALLAFVGVGAIPNAPAEPVRPAELAA
jgi:hypothetical protein